MHRLVSPCSSEPSACWVWPWTSTRLPLRTRSAGGSPTSPFRSGLVGEEERHAHERASGGGGGTSRRGRSGTNRGDRYVAPSPEGRDLGRVLRLRRRLAPYGASFGARPFAEPVRGGAVHRRWPFRHIHGYRARPLGSNPSPAT